MRKATSTERVKLSASVDGRCRAALAARFLLFTLEREDGVLYGFHRSGETASNSLASDVKRLCTLLGRSTRGLAYSIAAVG
ncbi:hypothetical protein [Sinorhizobium medicae]